MDRIYRWNTWYDNAPETWRFLPVLACLLALGAINMMMTIAFHFPFGLLVLLGILAVIAIRFPYSAGLIHLPEATAEAAGGDGAPTGHGATIRWDAGWKLNHWYETLPEWRRFYVLPVMIIVIGGINMLLTVAYHFPFGLLLLLAMLFALAVRLPNTWGWIKEPPGPSYPAIAHDPAPSAAPPGLIAHETPVAQTPPLHAEPERAPLHEEPPHDHPAA